MISHNIENCGKVLFSLNIPHEDIQRTIKLWNQNPVLSDALCSPAISKYERQNVIDKLFPQKITGFLKVMCEFDYLNDLNEIINAYENCSLEAQNIVKAQLYYVTEPSDKLKENFEQMLCKKYNASDAIVDCVEDKSLVGGYKLKIGDIEYDKSIKGTINALRKTLTAN